MAKLKFDRSINLYLNGNNITSVPQDEIWKVFLSGPNGDSGDLKINRIKVEWGKGSNTIGTNLLGGGTEISGSGTVTGVAFKVIS